jgi:hypothetical protein
MNKLKKITGIMVCASKLISVYDKCNLSMEQALKHVINLPPPQKQQTY